MRWMNKSLTAFALLIALLVFEVAHSAYYYPKLPARMASHFAGDGHANGWSGKPAFFVVHLATLAGTAALLSTIGWIMPWFPKSTVNLPHKEYWLSEQQAAKTYAVLSAQMMWFAAGTVAFFIGLGHLVFRANLLPQPRLSDGVWWLLVGYLAFTTIWCAGLLVRFARRPRDA
ncbi:MAG: DUF1648 domain-containing protein [Rhodopirellula sp.]|nr:DUF1648 domain-containing protein [Rhodopirellula sp.]